MRVQPTRFRVRRARVGARRQQHAYLARYLGFLLVEGSDLVVGEGRRAYVRTVAGL